MSFLERLKVNIEYILGRSDPALYVSRNTGQRLSLKVWQERWKIFSKSDGFIWYAVDESGNIAEFQANQTYVPEVFFRDASENNQLFHYFENLPETTVGKIPENLRKEIKPSGVNLRDFTKESNSGIFIFHEPEDIFWYQKGNSDRYAFDKTPYELVSMPESPLKLSGLPKEVQASLENYYFEGLRFEDCKYLDVSKYFDCKE